MTMRSYRLFPCLLLLLLAAGCASLAAPQTFQQRLAYAYASVATARNQAASMLERGRITKDEGRQVQALADQARAAVDLARGTAQAGDLSKAEGQLRLAQTVLTQLETYLKAQEAK